MPKVKDKEKNHKSSARKTTCNVQGNPHKTNRFFSRNSVGQKGISIFKMLKQKYFQLRILCLAKLPFKTEGEFFRQTKAKGVHH